MNLQELRYLVAIAEHRHFGRAAEACFVSQPTLSTQIKKLERQMKKSRARLLAGGESAGEPVIAR